MARDRREWRKIVLAAKIHYRLSAWGGEAEEEMKKKRRKRKKRTMAHTVFWDVTPCIKDVSGEPAVSIFRVEK
jgi:hypothetical protein